MTEWMILGRRTRARLMLGQLPVGSCVHESGGVCEMVPVSKLPGREAQSRGGRASWRFLGKLARIVSYDAWMRWASSSVSASSGR